MTTQTATSNLTVKTSKRISTTVIVWLGLMAWIVLVKFALELFYPQAFVDRTQRGFFDWPAIVLMGALGLVGALVATRTGFPDAWDARVSNRQRLLYPVVIGLGFGVVYVAIDLIAHYTPAVAAFNGAVQQYTGFVPMFLIFSTASIFVEIIYRLFPIPLMLGLASNIVLRGRGQKEIFWMLAVLTSLLEPFGQMMYASVVPGAVLALVMVNLFALNMTQATFFRRYGFFAAILVRVAFYLVWHALHVH
jgi:hypothetical protein